jgi:hypothetical protein
MTDMTLLGNFAGFARKPPIYISRETNLFARIEYRHKASLSLNLMNLPALKGGEFKPQGD